MGRTLSNSYSIKTPPTSTIGNFTLRTRCQSSKMPTAHLFLYLVDFGTALSTHSSSKPKRKIFCNEKKTLSRESILDHQRGRSASRAKCHAAKDKVNGKFIVLRIFFQWNSAGRRCLKLIAIHWRNISHFPSPFPPFFCFVWTRYSQTKSPTSLGHWICQKHFQYGNYISRIIFIACRPSPQKRKLSPIFFWGEGASVHRLSHYCRRGSLKRSWLKFRGGNDDRNGINSSPTEVIFDAILFVYPLRDAPAKNARAFSHEMAKFVLKMAHLGISMEPTQLLENFIQFSYGLLPRLWLLVSAFLPPQRTNVSHS